MNPEQSFPAPPNVPPSPLPAGGPNDPYQFIMNPNKAARSRVPLGGNSFIFRLAIILGAAVVLMVIVAVVINLLFGSKTNAAAFISLAQTQNELIRVSGEDTNASDQGVLNAATNTNLTLVTQQKALLAFLTSHGQKVAPKVLTLKKDATTDQQLTAAQAASTFDPVFTKVMVTQLQDYSDNLNTAYKNAASAKERKLLSDDYNQAQLLIKQWPASPSSVQTTN